METENNINIVVLLMSCVNNLNVISDISRWLADNQIEIVKTNQHTEKNMLYVRMELNFGNTNLSIEEIERIFSNIAKEYQIDRDIISKYEKKHKAVFVSEIDHHLIEFIARIKHNEIPGVLS